MKLDIIQFTTFLWLLDYDRVNMLRNHIENYLRALVLAPS